MKSILSGGKKRSILLPKNPPYAQRVAGCMQLVIIWCFNTESLLICRFGIGDVIKVVNAQIICFAQVQEGIEKSQMTVGLESLIVVIFKSPGGDKVERGCCWEGRGRFLTTTIVQDPAHNCEECGGNELIIFIDFTANVGGFGGEAGDEGIEDVMGEGLKCPRVFHF